MQYSKLRWAIAMSSVVSGGGGDVGGVKLEISGEACCVCEREDEELFSPEEHDAGAGAGEGPLRAKLLQLNNNKVPRCYLQL